MLVKAMGDPKEQPKNQPDDQEQPGEPDEPIFPLPDMDMELREGLEEGESHEGHDD